MQDWEEVKAVNAGIDRVIGTVELPEIRMSIAHSLKTAGKRLRPRSRKGSRHKLRMRRRR